MTNRQKIVILSPVFNDWVSYDQLIREILALDELRDFEVEIVCVNDGSTAEIPKSFQTIENLKIIHLIRNFGHQKAIGVGISYLVNHSDFDYIAVIDADGEDNPTDLVRLINNIENDKVILAKRIKRSETLYFRLMYKVYKFCFRILTGKNISFGNFSILPRNVAMRVATDADLFVNYSSCMLKDSLNIKLIDTNRKKRYSGTSSMNYQSLILHGFGAISIHIEQVSVRLLIGSLLSALMAFIAICVVLYIKLFTHSAIPGWATSFIIGMVLIIFQAIFTSFLLTFVVLNRKTQTLNNPKVDYANFLQ